MLRPAYRLHPGTKHAVARRGALTRFGVLSRRVAKAISTGDGSSSLPDGTDSTSCLLSAESPRPALSLKKTINALLRTGVGRACPGSEADVYVVESTKAAFGDYQYNGVMSIFANIGSGHEQAKNPRELAQYIAGTLELDDVIDHVDVAGPGFINFFVSDTFISSKSMELLKYTPCAKAVKNKKVIVDFSSPNIAKEMHVGHLRSTIIGDSICRALEYRGFEVLRLNHVGDWGTQFGMLIAYMSEIGEEGTHELSDLQSFYKRAKVRFDEDAEFKLRAQNMVTQLQSYDEETFNTWKRICEASRAEFQKIYDMLDVELEERGESYYNTIIKHVLDELVSKNIAETDDGALCIFRDGSSVPLICRKSDGGFNYASTDLAALYHRTQVENADWIIYVTDTSQKSHFDAIFDAGRRAGWLDDGKRVDHVGFGLVTGEDGKRLRTRSGETVKLKDLLMEAKSRSLQQFLSRGADSQGEKLESAALNLGVGAVKYADLRNNLSTNYTFSFERMLDMKGNTAVYLQYTIVRIKSIIQRANDADVGIDTEGVDEIKFKTPQERALLLHLLKFDDTLDNMINELMPSKICDYAYTLCVLFNNFYAECKIFGDSEAINRLLTCRLSLSTLETCFRIIGLQSLSRI